MERKSSKAHIAANIRYNAKAYDSMQIRLPKGEKAVIQDGASAAGESLAQYVLKAINMRRQQDGLEPIRTRIAE